MKILFLCTSNVFRSQMAEAFFNKYSKKHEAKSAAIIAPQDKIFPFTIRAMEEKGININQGTSKKVDQKMIEESDLVILMNSNLKNHLRNLKDKEIESWDVPDVVASESDEHLYPKFIGARDIIEQKVKELINRIG
jgi:protein-tyrosine-phosphatase